MKKRDLAILNDLERFRVLRRDDLIELRFSHLKQPVTACNTVMKRLRRDGYVEAKTDNHQYLYFLSPSPIKKDSVKIPHYLKIVEFYKSLLKYEPPKTFVVEPKYGEKGKYMEPDIFMLWKKGVFFVEVQRSVYSDRVMNAKVSRYEDYYFSSIWKNEAWQPQNKKIFPPVIIITDTRYHIKSRYVRFYQVSNVSELVNMFEPKQKEIKVSGISVKCRAIP